jgi:Fic family protein
MSEMCQYVNEHWDERGSLQLASYVLWRMNWIHPFADGNGRIARALMYVILSIHMGSILPGTPTIPDQIAADKTPYYEALEKSDASWKHGTLALGEMESMLEAMLTKQLSSAVQLASS